MFRILMSPKYWPSAVGKVLEVLSCELRINSIHAAKRP
jgi:hypothetical protein